MFHPRSPTLSKLRPRITLSLTPPVQPFEQQLRHFATILPRHPRVTQHAVVVPISPALSEHCPHRAFTHSPAGLLQPWVGVGLPVVQGLVPRLGYTRYCSPCSISRARANAEAKRPVGTATIPRPTMRTKKVSTRPPSVIGYMSPYPTVVNVVTDHQRA